MNLAPIQIDPKSFLYEHCAMPALPQVLTRIQEIMHSEDTSIEAVSDLIKQDPAMSAQVLKITNSAYYSLPMEISEVKMAVAYLGITEIHRIVLSYSVVNTINVEDENDFSQIWFHSLYSALCARHMAHKYRPLLNPGETWTSALLHDLGKLVYLKFFPEHFRALKQYGAEEGCLFSEAEEHFGLPTSSYLGTLLCHRWRLPQKVSEACGRHTLSDLKEALGREAVPEDSALIVTLGNLMAILNHDDLQEVKVDEISSVVMTVLDLEKPDFLALLGELSELKFETNRLL